MNIIEKCKVLQPKDAKNILRSLLFVIIKLTKGRYLSNIIKILAKIYAKFKKNILAEWD
ncbi:hypothetical protein [Candidatus Mycoplasma mahonii]|uniref:hypothetical protein n=1 Tax=Candidatus Mycoplasma mahonii TaxID=3004105 RepID=UPI0026F366BC|nr:hypothetical protein [Candidatus Mycoplasma mahonii]WKX02324.1 hypothetical protein O3I44_02870 [Candidatus Mycoplasma mahonii]